jgi:hypothetical protein
VGRCFHDLEELNGWLLSWANRYPVPLAHGGVLLPRDLLATLQAVHSEVRRLREAPEQEP